MGRLVRLSYRDVSSGSYRLSSFTIPFLSTHGLIFNTGLNRCQALNSGFVNNSIAVISLNASARVLPQVSRCARKLPQTGGRSGFPNSPHNPFLRCGQATPAGFPKGNPGVSSKEGMGELMLIASQHAPHPTLHSIGFPLLLQLTCQLFKKLRIGSCHIATPGHIC